MTLTHTRRAINAQTDAQPSIIAGHTPRIHMNNNTPPYWMLYVRDQTAKSAIHVSSSILKSDDAVVAICRLKFYGVCAAKDDARIAALCRTYGINRANYGVFFALSGLIEYNWEELSGSM